MLQLLSFMVLNSYGDMMTYISTRKTYNKFCTDSKAAGLAGIQNFNNASGSTLFKNPAGLALVKMGQIGVDFNFESAAIESEDQYTENLEYNPSYEFGAVYGLFPVSISGREFSFGVGYNNLFHTVCDIENLPNSTVEKSGGINFLTFGTGYKHGNFFGGFSYHVTCNSEVETEEKLYNIEYYFNDKFKYKYEGDFFSLGAGYIFDNFIFSLHYKSELILDRTAMQSYSDDSFYPNYEYYSPEFIAAGLQYEKNNFTYLTEIEYHDISEITIDSNYSVERTERAPFHEEDSKFSYRFGVEYSSKYTYRVGIALNNLAAKDYWYYQDKKANSDSNYEYVYSGVITIPYKDILELDFAMQLSDNTEVADGKLWFFNAYSGVKIYLHDLFKIKI